MEYFNLAILKLLPPIVQRDIALFTGKFWWDHKVHKLRPRWPVRYNKKCVSKINRILNTLLFSPYHIYNYDYNGEMRTVIYYHFQISNTSNYALYFKYHLQPKIQSGYQIVSFTKDTQSSVYNIEYTEDWI